ncbi:MAG: DUF4062 domain-containing protein [Sterolibacterium sp.]
MSQTRKTVFISSTAIDLPEHREKVAQACLERDYFPDGMERWPAADSDSLSLCLGMVDKADVFVGVYAHRYGWVPPGQTKSITELEYDRAVERRIPRLLFLMGEDHALTAKDFETGPGAEALKQFKQRIESERVRASFDNPDHLRAEVLHALGTVNEPQDDDVLRVDLTHLPEGAEHFLGRDAELAELDAAWADGGHTHIVELIAPGGTGKTALVKRWLERIKADDWRGARRVYGWSFYSQGTGDDRQASEDHFLNEALTWFGVEIEASANPWDKGRELALAVAATRTLLVLDGVEPLQYPPGPTAGELRAPGLKALLAHLASAGHPGLCMLSSREKLKDLAEYTRDADHGTGAVLRRDLGNLSDADGAKLLHVQGANWADGKSIDATHGELKDASREVHGHALTLSLLGRYLAKAYGGDIRQRKQVDFAKANVKTGGHAFRVIAAYETWFARAGDASAGELAALRLLGFFDRPATEANLAALRAAPAIAGLTEALVGQDQADWNATLSNLADCGLIYAAEADGTLDAHPLVREYLADALKTHQPNAWKEGHRRLYEQLKASAPHRPEGLADLQPLYQAVAHGCLAELWQQALDEVYLDRISRGNDAYVVHHLGAFGADLGAVACFFVEPWRRPVPALAENVQAWLLNQAAYRLRALGRLEEALAPMQAGAEMGVKQKNWKNAAIRYGNLSELQLSLGRVAVAVKDAEQSVGYADRSGDAFWRMSKRSTLADALHQQGETEAALARFVEAETMQAQQQTEFPLLYSLRGFQYCDLLLAKAERAAWHGSREPALAKRCVEVMERGKKMFGWRLPSDPLLDVAVDHLTLARCALYADRLQGQPPGQDAQTEAERAVAGLRAAGTQDHLPRGLVTRAWLRHCLNDLPGTEADLAEAHQIATRSSMRLHLADIALTRARLFHDRTALAQARQLIKACGYNRRLPELEDAEKSMGLTS